MDKNYFPPHWAEMCPQDFTYTDKPLAFIQGVVKFLEGEGFGFHVEPYHEGHFLHCTKSPLVICGIHKRED